MVLGVPIFKHFREPGEEPGQLKIPLLTSGIISCDSLS